MLASEEKEPSASVSATPSPRPMLGGIGQKPGNATAADDDNKSFLGRIQRRCPQVCETAYLPQLYT